MVSKAKEVLPDPETPEITTNLFLGIEREMFFKLLTFAFFIFIYFGSDMFF